MKKLRCESCGGELIVDESNEYATCSYCQTKYKLNEDKTINIKLDDSVKETIKEGTQLLRKASPFTTAHFAIGAIIPIIAFIFIISIAIFMFYGISGSLTDEFNSTYEMHSGTQYQTFVANLLDDVVTNNKKSKDRIITVVYNDISTTDPTEITSIKHSLKQFEKYEVSLDYNTKGYVNKITISDIE